MNQMARRHSFGILSKPLLRRYADNLPRSKSAFTKGITRCPNLEGGQVDNPILRSISQSTAPWAAVAVQQEFLGASIDVFGINRRLQWPQSSKVWLRWMVMLSIARVA